MQAFIIKRQPYGYWLTHEWLIFGLVVDSLIFVRVTPSSRCRVSIINAVIHWMLPWYNLISITLTLLSLTSSRRPVDWIAFDSFFLFSSLAKALEPSNSTQPEFNTCLIGFPSSVLCFVVILVRITQIDGCVSVQNDSSFHFTLMEAFQYLHQIETDQFKN